MAITRVPLRTVQPLPEPPVTGMTEPVSTLDTLLRSVAARNPGATAVVAPGRVALDFVGLVGQVDEVRAALVAAGLGPADRVAVSLPQGPEMAVAVLGVASALPCVPLDPRSRAEELAPYLAEAGARAVIVPRAGEHPARAAAHAAGLRVLTVDLPAGAPAGRFLLAAGASGVAPGTPAHNRGVSAAPAAPRADAVALVLPTSGTTSRPKRVQLSHANLCASARSIAAALALGSGDRALIAMPLFHIHGLLMWLATLGSGGSAACPPAFDPARFAAWLEELRPTWYSAVPTIHHAVVALARLDRARAARVGLRFVRSSSAPLPPRLGAELEALFGAPVIEAYGMTEASHQIASNPLPPGERRPGSVGHPAGAEVSVVDEAGCPLPPGTQGEVAIRGDGVTACYERIPTGPNGKIQRPRLAEFLGLAMPRPRGAEAPPATPTELAVAGIWSDVLGVEVGRNGDFFELGGHSLLALRVLALIHERLGVELDLRVVFDAPTVEAIASTIDARRSAAAPADDLDPILDALAGLGDEQVRRVIGARDDRSQG